MNFKRINCIEALTLLERHGSDGLQIVDIRDDAAYSQGHIESARHLHGANMQEFIDSADWDRPVLVYCYHGHMSQSAAAYLAERGFTESYSLDGGYEAWRQRELTS
jgi:thiosulfate sulfurtransferase